MCQAHQKLPHKGVRSHGNSFSKRKIRAGWVMNDDSVTELKNVMQHVPMMKGDLFFNAPLELGP